MLIRLLRYHGKAGLPQTGFNGQSGGIRQRCPAGSQRLVSVEAEVNSLIRDMEASIKETDAFIGAMAKE